jgi:hypothetical protein
VEDGAAGVVDQKVDAAEFAECVLAGGVDLA